MPETWGNGGGSDQCLDMFQKPVTLFGARYSSGCTNFQTKEDKHEGDDQIPNNCNEGAMDSRRAVPADFRQR